MAEHRDDRVHETRPGEPVREPVHRDEPAHREEVAHESRREVVGREREEHGGVKIGSAFFGWLAAMGMAVILTAIAAAAGTAVGVATDTDTASEVRSQAETLGVASAIVLLVILFIAYYCGGYVAGRMARFDGAKQGIAVWLWAIVVAILVAIIGAVAGDEYNVLQRLDAFPRIPIGEGELTTGGIIGLVLFVVVTLGGAVVGGLAGMRFHRKVDKTGLGR
jgi:amino acid transporter